MVNLQYLIYIITNLSFELIRTIRNQNFQIKINLRVDDLLYMFTKRGIYMQTKAGDYHSFMSEFFFMPNVAYYIREDIVLDKSLEGSKDNNTSDDNHNSDNKVCTIICDAFSLWYIRKQLERLSGFRRSY